VAVVAAHYPDTEKVVHAMICPDCNNPAFKAGKNRNGSRRFGCGRCGKTFTDPTSQPPDGRRLDPAKRVMVLRMILEGNSCRSTARLTGVKTDTVVAAVVEAGTACKAFLERTVKDVPAENVQADEIWGFVGMKDRTRRRKGIDESADVGDAWCFTAIDRDTKLLLAWNIDKRTADATESFARKLRGAVRGRPQVTTDGFTSYVPAFWAVFGREIDHASLIKVFGPDPGLKRTERRYSPPVVVDTFFRVGLGMPDMTQVSTSHAERQNLSIRMGMRRMTRLTNGHSNKL
jgi:transposase-like protein/IS1 family transposase